jgi:hypothetical protein
MTQILLDRGLGAPHLVSRPALEGRQVVSLPGFHLLSHRLEVSLHSVDAN